MIVAILIAIAVISMFGWLNYWVGSAALAKYMADKGYTPPSDEEMAACCSYVWKKLFHIH